MDIQVIIGYRRFTGMHLKIDVRLDPTLGCGQAHRWRKTGDIWQGILGKSIVNLKQSEDGIVAEGDVSEKTLLEYFRSEDDLDMIIGEISERDPYVASLSAHCPGLRILKQDEWECLATYLLATNANVARIGKMVESVCDRNRSGTQTRVPDSEADSGRSRPHRRMQARIQGEALPGARPPRRRGRHRSKGH